jgi:hypothetical protein
LSRIDVEELTQPLGCGVEARFVRRLPAGEDFLHVAAMCRPIDARLVARPRADPNFAFDHTLALVGWLSRRRSREERSLEKVLDAQYQLGSHQSSETHHGHNSSAAARAPSQEGEQAPAWDENVMLR